MMMIEQEYLSIQDLSKKVYLDNICKDHCESSIIRIANMFDYDIKYISRINKYSNALRDSIALGIFNNITNYQHYKHRHNYEQRKNFISINKTKNKENSQMNKDYKVIIYDFIKERILSNIHTTINLFINPDNMVKFIKWLSKYDKNWKKRIYKSKLTGVYEFRNMDIFIIIDNNTLCRIRTGEYIKRALSDYDIISNDIPLSKNDIRIDLYGKQCFKLLRFFNTLEALTSLSCYKVVYNENSLGNCKTEVYYTQLLLRSKNTMFLDDIVIKGLFSHINRFLSNKEKYKSRDLLYKTGILLYGPPGTGKSSIARMICSEYNISMILIDMSQFSNIDIDYITTSINADNRMYAIVLEDIDRVMDDKESDRHEAVNRLLQFLDSSSSPTNVIFIATTNHLDRLDPAITRDGRFDVMLSIEDIHKNAAINMIKSFGVDSNDAEEIWNKNNKNGTINPAKLQNLILNYQGEKELELQED